ncbi:MAG TPA: PRC-barrel domain-containing protein [Streptosporangiaceae bacterium]
MEEFTLGARASCPDGFCGVVSGTIVDPATRTVTHLVVEPENGTVARLVPLDLVEGTADDVRLRCPLDEFGRLDPAEKVLGDTWSGAGDYSSGGLGQGRRRPLVVEQAVPLGETEVERHQSVHAVDGEIGQVEGFMVNPADDKVTYILLEEGHLWGRKQVAIPVSAVASIDDGIRLNITKQQVENLPPPGQPG